MNGSGAELQELEAMATQPGPLPEYLPSGRSLKEAIRDLVKELEELRWDRDRRAIQLRQVSRQGIC